MSCNKIIRKTDSIHNSNVLKSKKISENSLRHFTPPTRSDYSRAATAVGANHRTLNGSFGTQFTSHSSDSDDTSTSNSSEMSNNRKDDPKLRIVNYSKINEPENSNVEIGPMNTLAAYNPQIRGHKLSKKEIREKFAYFMLPSNYPHSVTEGYAKFSMLFGVSAF